MKIINYRMNGLSWDVSKNETLLTPIDRDFIKKANDLITESKPGMFGLCQCKSKNGVEYCQVQVGRSGWSHRGADYHSVKFGNTELRTRSYSSAIKMFIKKASK